MKKLIYLISPKKIDKKFFISLEKVLSVGNVKYFQLRLKKINKRNIFKFGKKIKVITKKYKVKLIINDNVDMAIKIKADGCHMGQQDGSLKIARKKLKKKILGVTCHNSIQLAKHASKCKADYLAFGSFFKSNLKPKAKRANLEVLKKAKKSFNKPIIAIGGINNQNFNKVLNSGAKYISLSSFIWDNPNLKPEIAIKKFK